MDSELEPILSVEKAVTHFSFSSREFICMRDVMFPVEYRMAVRRRLRDVQKNAIIF